MGFMKPQIEEGSWIEIETTHGTESIPMDVPIGGLFAPAENLKDYIEGEYISHDVKHGWGARLSAPGYMDCTPWCVFDTEDEAKEYLLEMYDEEIEQ